MEMHLIIEIEPLKKLHNVKTLTNELEITSQDSLSHDTHHKFSYSLSNLLLSRAVLDIFRQHAENSLSLHVKSEQMI